MAEEDKNKRKLADQSDDEYDFDLDLNSKFLLKSIFILKLIIGINFR